MRGSRDTAVVLLVLSLLLVACGARLTEEQRDLAIGRTAPGGEVAGAPTGGSEAAASGADGEVAAPSSASDSGSAASASSPSAEAASGSSGDGGQSGEGGDAGSGGSGEGGSGGGDGAAAAAGDEAWRQMPDGGNGGATGVGVTEESITLANVSDVSGAIPGMFEDTQLAVAAYLAYHNATQGPIYGRALEYLPLDSRMDSNGNRQQYLRACDEALAAVGSQSAFEEGAVEPISSCGIPDLRTTVASEPLVAVDNVTSVISPEAGAVGSAEYRYWKQQHPEAIERSAMLWVESETSRFRAQGIVEATGQLGYEWVYEQGIQVAESNYSGFVLDMQEQGVDFVTIIGDYSHMVRLAEAMRQQDFWPTQYALLANGYRPEYVETGGAAVEGTEVAVPSALIEEMDGNEEMQRYAEWLSQVDPSAEPTSLGMIAWSGAKLMTDVLKRVGPEVTRQAVLEELRTVEDWTGGGLHGPQHVGPKRLSSCMIIAEVVDGGFQRRAPDDGFMCEGTLSID